MRRLLPTLLILLLSTLITAQEELPAPQFLYRDDNRLVLLDGYTGETTELPIEVSDGDRFEWSPDGKYLLTFLYEGGYSRFCMNLYDVDEQMWLHEKPISCGVTEAIFSDQGIDLIYVSDDEYNGVLWQYTIGGETKRELYRTEDGIEIRPTGISQIEWSPTRQYVTFVNYRWIVGGTLNSFVVINLDNHKYITVEASEPYYASYDPIWSEDERWFLITLKDHYRISIGLPFSNHQGDLYLINSDTGQEYRITYTPTVLETDIRWTEDGNIAFTEVIYTEHELTLEEAMNVEPVPNEATVAPEDFDEEEFYDPFEGVLVSPDRKIGAWTSSSLLEEGIYAHELSIGDIYGKSRTASFTITFEASMRDVVIGWRPSDYPYEQQE